LFSIEKFDIKLGTEFIGRNFVYCEEIDSTNSFLLKSKEYNKHGLVLLAEYQSAGRGRRNRSWLSTKEQNLTFSILLKENISSGNINSLILGAAVAVAQALENLYQFKVNLKWPNDVLINNRKISGILVESSSKGNKIEKAVIGIAVNVNQSGFAGQYTIQPTSVRKEFKKEVSREKLLSEILNCFEEIFEQSLINPEKVLNDWRSRCKLIGEKIKIEDEGKTIHGVFEDIDKNGYLLLRTPKELSTIHFGDISLRQ